MEWAGEVRGSSGGADSDGRGFLLRVYGKPAPQGSKRLSARGAMFESNPRTRVWREDVVGAVIRDGLNGIMLTGPLRVRCLFIFARPKSHYTARGEVKATAPVFYSKTPDGDKLLRSTFDALTSAGFIKDDALIYRGMFEKVYANTSEPEGALIYIRKEPHE